MMHMNIAGLDEPDFDGHQVSNDEGIDALGEYTPGLIVQENEFHDKELNIADLNHQ
jgi:hypothetical protein